MQRINVYADRFYALDVGLGVASCRSESARCTSVSMPSMSGWWLRGRGQVADLLFCTPFLCPRCRAGCCEASSSPSRRPDGWCSYALDVGLGGASPFPKLFDLQGYV